MRAVATLACGLLLGCAAARPEIAAEYVSVFPRARFVSVPECGHLNWLEQPATYAREIEAFLDDG